MESLCSEFGENVDSATPLSGHPNPYFERKDFVSLNGAWDFAISQSPTNHGEFETIIVPFAPETAISGVGKRIKGTDYLHYRKEFIVPKEKVGTKGLLHFEAVDAECWVYANGILLGEHKGGYLPFSFVIPSLSSPLVIEVVAHDDTDSPIYPKGKQSSKPGSIWYTPTSGIWGSVWLEFIPERRILSLRIKADYDARKIDLRFESEEQSGGVLRLFFEGKEIFNGDVKKTDSIDLSHYFYPWSYDKPNLYEARLICGEDEVITRFGIRKIGTDMKDGKRYFLLNDKPTYMSALLDQGYFPESGLTPPSVEAIENDILLAKSAGFNCLRKHIKVEPMKFYYACDRLGMLVIQDMVNNGGPYKLFLIATAPFIPYKIKDKPRRLLGSSNPEAQKQFEADMLGTIEHLSPVASIVTWTIFNEGWGQFDSKRLYSLAFQQDDSRTYDVTSGWFDQGAGDYNSKHVYFRKPKLKNDGKRLLSLSEFGGYSCPIEGHMEKKNKIGYKKIKSKEETSKSLLRLFETSLEPLIEQEALSCSVLTQLSDVEGEINGIVTYDRKVVKIDVEAFKKENEKLQELYEQSYNK